MRKLLKITSAAALAIVMLASPLSAFAALVNDANTSGQRTTSGTTLTVSITVTADIGAEGIGIAIVETVDANNITGVTWNGAAMTSAVSSQTGDYKNISIWYKTGIASGTYDVIATGGTTATVKMYLTAYRGADQSSPIGATNTGSGASSAPSVSITTQFASSTIISGSSSDGDPGAPDASQTNIAAQMFGNSHTGTGTREGPKSIGADTQSWANSVTAWGVATLELKETQAPAPSARKLRGHGITR